MIKKENRNTLNKIIISFVLMISFVVNISLVEASVEKRNVNNLPFSESEEMVLGEHMKNMLSYKREENSNIIHIGYGIDNNYARCCATSIASFCINNPNQNFTFHIITNNLSLSSKEKYNLLAKDYLIDIYIFESKLL